MLARTTWRDRRLSPTWVGWSSKHHRLLSTCAGTGSSHRASRAPRVAGGAVGGVRGAWGARGVRRGWRREGAPSLSRPTASRCSSPRPSWRTWTAQSGFCAARCAPPARAAFGPRPGLGTGACPPTCDGGAGDGAPCVGRMRSARPGQKQSGERLGDLGLRRPGRGAAPRTGPPPLGGGQAAAARAAPQESD